jgi:hypothetical protein
MKKNYIAPEINMVMIANEDVMTLSTITTPWIDFNSSFDVDDVDEYN